MKDYKVITLCGSTRFREDFEAANKRLTLEGNIVISVGLFGHSGDGEVWDGMDEGTLSKTKRMLDDMHKAKIDLADEIFVINPTGYIGKSTWSEICYAYMTKKPIGSMMPIDGAEIEKRVQRHMQLAKELAAQQYDEQLHNAEECGGKKLARFVEATVAELEK